MNLVQLQEQVKGMPVQALIQMAQAPQSAMESIAAIGEIERRNKMQEQATAAQGKPQGTTADAVLGRASTSMGIGQMIQQQAMAPGGQGQPPLPSAAPGGPGLPNSVQSQMPQGGMPQAAANQQPQGFKDGGHVKPPLDQIEELPYVNEEERRDAVRDETSSSPPINAWLEKYSPGWLRLAYARMTGTMTPEELKAQMQRPLPEGYERPSNYNEFAEDRTVVEPGVSGPPGQWPPQARGPGFAQGGQIPTMDEIVVEGKRPQRSYPSGANLVGVGGEPPAPGIEGLPPLLALFGAGGKGPSLDQSASQAQGLMGEDRMAGIEGLQALRDEQNKKNSSQAKWTALLGMGNSLMASKSPNFLTNLGVAGDAGIKGLVTARGDESAAADKALATRISLAEAGNRRQGDIASLAGSIYNSDANRALSGKQAALSGAINLQKLGSDEKQNEARLTLARDELNYKISALSAKGAGGSDMGTVLKVISPTANAVIRWRSSRDGENAYQGLKKTNPTLFAYYEKLQEYYINNLNSAMGAPPDATGGIEDVAPGPSDPKAAVGKGTGKKGANGWALSDIDTTGFKFDDDFIGRINNQDAWRYDPDPSNFKDEEE